MSYVALITASYDEVIYFYGELLGFPIIDQWQRSNARGCRFDTGGMLLEIIDNKLEKPQLDLGRPADKIHIVIEVENIEEERKRIKIDTLPIQNTSWGAYTFQIRDPDGVSVTFLQWTKTKNIEL